MDKNKRTKKDGGEQGFVKKSFGDIKPGQVFQTSDGAEYLKTERIQVSGGGDLNCVGVNFGIPTFTNNNQIVRVKTDAK